MSEEVVVVVEEEVVTVGGEVEVDSSLTALTTALSVLPVLRSDICPVTFCSLLSMVVTCKRSAAITANQRDDDSVADEEHPRNHTICSQVYF